MFHRSLYKAYSVAFIILFLCLLPGGSLPKVGVSIVSFDKWVHLMMYIPLAWTLAYGFKKQKRYPKLALNALWWVFLVASFYGAFIELLQFSLTPDRCAELFDIIADIAGVGFGILTHKLGIRLIVRWNEFWNKLVS